ncbi:hypothetical protein CHS0354_007775 [Potamilus streckersoni]|uniref:EF-hand domain-containing protein n=1 Tax=Potamilus streckersoni TaxID=2493646 RepID=A0AAE0VJ11_9BIVA|nr:hypothetical protein CHS0354_007775 [Potamilus streckersoni]
MDVTIVLGELTDDKIREFKEAFKMYDKDNDGLISTQKLGAVLRALGNNPTEIEIQEMIDEVDSEEAWLMKEATCAGVKGCARYDNLGTKKKWMSDKIKMEMELTEGCRGNSADNFQQVGKIMRSKRYTSPFPSLSSNHNISKFQKLFRRSHNGL